MSEILIFHSDELLRATTGTMLKREGFGAIWASDVETGIGKARALNPRLIVIDVPIGGISGLELCLQLRACKIQTPIIILSESQEEVDKVLLLEAGADDYVVKPFSARELLARIRALLRRATANPARTIRFGDVEIDAERRVISCRGNQVSMTPCEYSLLLFFVRNADRPLTRDALLNSVWGYDQYPNTRTVDAHVSRLRNKFEPDPAAPRHFLTIHGVGYRFLM